jgi:hypothetical protein
MADVIKRCVATGLKANSTAEVAIAHNTATIAEILEGILYELHSIQKKIK